ncbi:MAG TPA: hypothetical protein EYN03_09125, partial [Planctomycetes bacterium]|nr:hypothetical protein [Planctomycetota bacterium]
MTVTNLLMAETTAPLTIFFNFETKLLLSVVFGLLVIALLGIYALRRQPESFVNPAVRRTFELRVRAWC